MKPSRLEEVLEAFSFWKYGEVHAIRQMVIKSVSGGDINEAFHIRDENDHWFLKRNLTERYPDMLGKELRGLDALEAQIVGNIPSKRSVFSFGMYTYLIMQHFEHGDPTPKHWESLHDVLSRLHEGSAAYFGWEEDNYIGTLPQSNQKAESFGSFFTHSRLYPFIGQVYNQFDRSEVRGLEYIMSHANDLFPMRAPQLVHGDLWVGNVLFGSNGGICLVDPAVYYGIAEMDLAMLDLFGRLPSDFFDRYEEKNHHVRGWQRRKDLFQLYPILVHWVLFGGSYARSVSDILRKFGK